MTTIAFPPAPSDKAQLEHGSDFSPRFDADGLIAAVVTDALSKAVLMVAYMNEEALALTLRTGIAHYWSRSRARLWRKGDTSGNTQKVVEMRTDCDQDTLWITVEVAGEGVACHTGRTSCFYRVVELDGDSARLIHAGPDRDEPAPEANR